VSERIAQEDKAVDTCGDLHATRPQHAGRLAYGLPALLCRAKVMERA
jgi:hypothetical protein